MTVSDLKRSIPEGFDGPTDLPRTPEQRQAWQDANRSWWESHPMRYDFSDEIQADEFSKEFYREIDERFYSDVREFMPWQDLPFDALLNFSSLQDKDVLEIGVGNGSHAQLISSRAGSYTGIDLTDYAVNSTTKRLQQIDTNGGKGSAKVIRMDAESMDFPDRSFDLVWSWGVIHHSANTRKILEEIQRVLRPGGVAITMVYHRSFWSYYIFAGLFGGLAQRTLLKTRSFHRARQKMIDGAIARYYSIREWRALTSDLFSEVEIKIYGSKAELLPLPNGKLKATIKSFIPNSVSRFLTNRCRMGMFLVSTLKKPELRDRF
ncbi:MAG: class I SAM-dependent methyltransferase [Pyrinomonadaceae bacterium]|nr:class I SAM-dependent methyltransferase [Pyrinomonadaceae bacterium]